MKIKLNDGQELFIPKDEGAYRLKEGRKLKATVNIEVVSEDEDGCTVEVRSITLPERTGNDRESLGDKFNDYARDNSGNVEGNY